LLIVFDTGMNFVFTYMFYRPLAEVIDFSKNGQFQDESHIKRRLILKQILKETLLTSMVGMTFNFLGVLILYMNEVNQLGDNYGYSWMQWLPAWVPLVNSSIMFFALRRALESVLGNSVKPVSAQQAHKNSSSAKQVSIQEPHSPKTLTNGFQPQTTSV
jgi:hypothetical protein